MHYIWLLCLFNLLNSEKSPCLVKELLMKALEFCVSLILLLRTSLVIVLHVLHQVIYIIKLCCNLNTCIKTLNMSLRRYTYVHIYLYIYVVYGLLIRKQIFGQVLIVFAFYLKYVLSQIHMNERSKNSGPIPGNHRLFTWST